MICVIIMKYNEKPTATRDIGNEYSELMKKHPDLYVLNADLAGSLKVTKAKADFPDRVIEVGISEQNMMSIAYGLALRGRKVIVNTFAQFMMLGWNQMYQAGRGFKPKIIYRATHAGIGVGTDGESAQALGDLGAMTSNSGIDFVVDPVDYNEALEILAQLLEIEGTAYIRTYRQNLHALLPKDFQPSIGKGYLFPKNTESRTAIVACGPMLEQASKAQEILEKDGIKIKIVSFSTIKPRPQADTIKNLVEECDLVITAEDHLVHGGGLADALAPSLNKLGVKHERIGMYSYGETGTPEALYRKFGLDAESIAIKAAGLIKPV
jgi:transketolase